MNKTWILVNDNDEDVDVTVIKINTPEGNFLAVVEYSNGKCKIPDNGTFNIGFISTLVDIEEFITGYYNPVPPVVEEIVDYCEYLMY